MKEVIERVEKMKAADLGYTVRGGLKERVEMKEGVIVKNGR